MDKGVRKMSETQQEQGLEDNEDSPYAKFFSEIFVDEEDKFMYEVDFNTFIGTLDAWLDEEEKISPDIARYMGYVLMGVANKLDGN
jgi:hypothetical protein